VKLRATTSASLGALWLHACVLNPQGEDPGFEEDSNVFGGGNREQGDGTSSSSADDDAFIDSNDLDLDPATDQPVAPGPTGPGDSSGNSSDPTAVVNQPGAAGANPAASTPAGMEQQPPVANPEQEDPMPELPPADEPTADDEMAMEGADAEDTDDSPDFAEGAGGGANVDAGSGYSDGGDAGAPEAGTP